MAVLPHGLIQGTVTDHIDWTDTVFSLRVKAPISAYIAGQFTKLALQTASGEWIRRAYSLVNSPNHKKGYQEMEFLLITAPDGQLRIGYKITCAFVFKIASHSRLFGNTLAQVIV